MTLRSLALLLLLSGPSQAATTGSSNFTEERQSKSQNRYLEAAKKSAANAEKKLLEDNRDQIESARTLYAKFNNRVRVPGFISASPIPQVGRIVGPKSFGSVRMGDTIFVRWSGAPLPRPGDRFMTYSPAVVLQNLMNPTDFDVVKMPGPTTKLPEDRRLAGYIYEATGKIRVQKIQGGVVYAMVEQLSGVVEVGDEVMQTLPLVDNLTPIRSGIQISAAVVCGSPVDRLSSTTRSYLYLNRGSRDGIRVGRVFEAIDTAKLDEAVGGSAPELSNGEAVVVHVTDSYSTAMITKAFDVIRIGSLLRAKQEEVQVLRNAPFNDYEEITAKKEDAGAKLPQVPAIDKLPGGGDESLPEPRKRPSGPPLSELDELEQSMKLKSLTPAEKNRLDKLSRQEKLGASHDDAEELSDTPGAPTVENSFKDGKKPAKKDAKKKPRSKNDEEELNLLMMQN